MRGYSVSAFDQRRVKKIRGKMGEFEDEK